MRVLHFFLLKTSKPRCINNVARQHRFCSAISLPDTLQTAQIVRNQFCVFLRFAQTHKRTNAQTLVLGRVAPLFERDAGHTPAPVATCPTAQAQRVEATRGTPSRSCSPFRNPLPCFHLRKKNRVNKTVVCSWQGADHQAQPLGPTSTAVPDPPPEVNPSHFLYINFCRVPD